MITLILCDYTDLSNDFTDYQQVYVKDYIDPLLFKNTIYVDE